MPPDVSAAEGFMLSLAGCKTNWAQSKQSVPAVFQERPTGCGVFTPEGREPGGATPSATLRMAWFFHHIRLFQCPLIYLEDSFHIPQSLFNLSSLRARKHDSAGHRRGGHTMEKGRTQVGRDCSEPESDRLLCLPPESLLTGTHFLTVLLYKETEKWTWGLIYGSS